MITTTDTIRTDKGALLDALQQAGADVHGDSVRCPFHDDTNPSGGVYADDSGIWRFKCHGASCGFCGDVYDVQARAQGRDVKDVLRDQHHEARGHAEQKRPARTFGTLDELKAAAPGTVEATYLYTDPDTRRLELVVVRFRSADGKKAFWQASSTGDGLILKAPLKPWPLYNRTRVRDADTIVVCEGEKCVHILHEFGIVATTNPGGAGKSQHADWTPLVGKRVVLWPDADAAGHMRDVARILDTLESPPSVSMVDPGALGLSGKDDVEQFMESLGDVGHDTKRQALLAVLDDAEPVGASIEVRDRLEATISGERRAVSWPWGRMAKLSKALLPGTVTLVCGDPGAVKSLMLLQALVHWLSANVRVAVFELEEDRAFHLHRVLAQVCHDSRLLDDEWVSVNPDDAREAYTRNADLLDMVGRSIWQAPTTAPSLRNLATWVKQRAEAGHRIIAIDPVTAARVGERQWQDDLEFMMAVKAAVREHDASLVLVTHPKKGRKHAIGLDELAGGAAYQRFSQTVLWLEHHATPKEVVIHSGQGTASAVINRTVHMAKTRNGRGAGLSVGLNFDPETLLLREVGTIAVGGPEE